jgi:hypothetical protein
LAHIQRPPFSSENFTPKILHRFFFVCLFVPTSFDIKIKKKNNKNHEHTSEANNEYEEEEEKTHFEKPSYSTKVYLHTQFISQASLWGRQHF